MVRIAKLARLELTGEEIEKMQKDLSAILDYFNVLKKAPVMKDRPIDRSMGLSKNVVRQDIVSEKPAGLAGDLVQLSPDTKDGYVKVKNMF